MTHAIHDFSAKLRQPDVVDHLREYVEWRKLVRQAEADGSAAPAAPKRSPISINLDLTVACNYRCTHCIDWDILNTGHRLADKNLRESIRWMAAHGLRSVILIGGGEPTLYPGFVAFVQFLKEEMQLQVAVVSNGSRGDRLQEAAAFMDEQDWIRLSLDSASNELFVAMHKPNSKDINLDVICASMRDLKAEYPKPKLGFSYVIIWSGASREENSLLENIHEIVPAAARAREYGFDYISFKPVLERQSDGAEVMDPSKISDEESKVVANIRSAVNEAKELQSSSFQVFESINLRLLEENSWKDYTRQPRTCHMQALRQVLTPTGLFNCPAHRGVEKAKIAEKEAYAGEEAANETNGQLAGLLKDFNAQEECAEVTCLYNKVNWWIDSMIEDPRNATESIEATAAGSDFFL
ncbi:MAG: wyosine [tRNA(Phe)-imidazoG37] synthetase (radical SAM superfamily) [Glaciecola sp.]